MSTPGSVLLCGVDDEIEGSLPCQVMACMPTPLLDSPANALLWHAAGTWALVGDWSSSWWPSSHRAVSGWIIL